MRNWGELLQLCENDIRRGRADRIRQHLAGLNLREIPRKFRLPLANLCRRSSLLVLGLKILTPIVRGERDASAEEKAEYAVLLQRSGSVREALTLLGELRGRPEILLFTAFCHFNLWDYAEAVPVLEAYLQTDLPEYSKLVGHVNLAAALIVVGRFDEADDLLTANLGTARDLSASRLEGNCHELRAQIAIERGSREEASMSLEKASVLLRSEQTLDRLFIEKWRAVLAGTSEALLAFRSRAQEFGDSESVRETDLALVRSNFDHERFQHLYFGSPLAGYRRRILDRIGREPVESEYRYGIGGRCFDLATGEGVGDLNTGKKIHQVFAVLLRDFYKPLSVNALFAELFRHEHFDVNSSPSRVHQLLRRSRAWLREAEVDASIEEANGQYRLIAGPSVSFRINVDLGDLEPRTPLLAKLRAVRSTETWFSARDACESLGLSATSGRRLLQWGLETGRLEKQGASTKTVYRFPPSAPDLSVSGTALRKAS